MEQTESQNRPHLLGQLQQNEQTIMELQQRIKELEDGLRPFAELANTNAFKYDLDDYEVQPGYLDHKRYRVTVGDFRRAATLLPEKKTNE